MKNFIYLILLVPYILNAQIEFYYDPVTNLLSLEFDECSACAFDPVSDVTACRCHDDCDKEFGNCRQDCIDNFSGLTDLSACIESCQNSERNYRNRCGDDPIRAGNITSYAYRFLYSYAPIPLIL